MQFETPQDASAPLRRLRRRTAAPAAGFEGSAGGRAEQRDGAIRPAVVWAKAEVASAAFVAGVASVAETMDAAPVAAPVIPAPAAEAPLTRREARARAAARAAATPTVAVAAVVETPSEVESVVETPSEVTPVVETPSEILPIVEAAPAAEPFELLEPVSQASADTVDAAVVEDTEPEQDTVPQASTLFSDFEADEFEAAARLFSFTGETLLQSETVADAAEGPAAEDAPAEHAAPRKKKPRRIKPAGSSFKRMATASFSVGAMTLAGLLAVGMTTPSGAVASAAAAPENPATSVLAGEAPSIEAEDIQAYVAPAQVENVQIEREESYEITSLAEMAKADGINHTSSLYWNDPTAAIQWPFPVGVPMSYGWGMRWGRMHTGIDLTPGNGAKIQAIADGVVRSASNATGGYGVNIYIDHVIDGRVITSHYAHMQYGSMQVQAGDHVKVGDVIGVVGNTGHSFGAHLHFEILVQGTLVDPLSWMRKNAGRHSLG